MARQLRPRDPRGAGRRSSLMLRRESLHRFVDLWWLWAIAALAAGAITTAAAQGFPIVDLELAGTAERANEIMRGVDLGVVRMAILWDFLFILFYAPALFFGSLWARRQFAGDFARRVGTVIAIGGLIAGALDLVENVAMLAYLRDPGGWGGWNPLAAAMAIPKF
ncbi:MAG: hypothetical protein U9R51_00890, partial [Actinomycetota bacterium]|nr:hypothetical protein [Actinomycetota bacterium]